VSFCDPNDKPDEKSPVPRYMPRSLVQKKLYTDVDDVLYGFEKPEHGGLICTDKEALDK
jgi:hypothetical protein